MADQKKTEASSKMRTSSDPKERSEAASKLSSGSKKTTSKK